MSSTLAPKTNKKNSFATAVDFSLYVEKQAVIRGITALQALREIMDELDIDPSSIKPLLSESLKQKLFLNGCELGCMKVHHSSNTLQSFFSE